MVTLVLDRESVIALAAEIARLIASRSPAPPTPPEVLFMPPKQYAQRVAVSVRPLRDLVAAGLPTVGTGRARRVDVRRADEWLRTRVEPADAARAAFGKTGAR